MSSALINTAINFVGGTLATILLRQGRSIGGIIPNVTIEEHHRDDLAITDHPVEQGAAITDHSFKMPAEVTMQCGWSSSGALFGSLTLTSPRDIYQQLLLLQASRQPFDLVTGKRSYSNMLIKSLGVTTNAASENSLMVTCTMREVIIVQTQVTTIAPAAVHANPAATAATQNTGVKQPVPVQPSILYNGSKAISKLFGGS